MQFHIQNRLFLPIVIFISAISVTGLFQMAGLPSPLGNPEHRIGGIALFIITMLGMVYIIGNVLSFVLQKSFPKQFAHR